MRAFTGPIELRSFLPPDFPLENHRAILGHGELEPDLVLVQYQPNGWDMQTGMPLSGKYGLPIRRYFAQNKIKIYTTTVFPFFRGNDKAKATDVRQAAPVVAEELRRVKCDKYLLLGADAARYLPTFDYPFRKFNEVVNRTFEIDGKRFRVAHAPAAIATNPQIYAQFIASVEDLLNPPQTPLIDTVSREDYRAVENRYQARQLLKKMNNPVACDLETTGLDPWQDRILTVNLSWEHGTGIAMPWELFTPDEWASILGGRRLIFQNGTFDVKFLAVNGVLVQIYEDALLMHSLVDETPGSHSMDQMSNRYLGIDKWGETVDYDDMSSVDFKTLGRYGARDTDITLRLADHFRPLVVNRNIHRVLHKAQNAVTRSEIRGIRIDREKAHQFAEEIEKALHDRREYLADVYGLQNANSPKQVAELLYEEMGLPVQKLKGKVTTSDKAIEAFKAEHSVVRDILEYRHLTKAGSTYVRKILEVSEHDGRYHPEFRLAATETGRVAEKLITLIPRPDRLVDPDLGKRYQVRLRELFLPDEGYLMIGADYRGLEVGMSAYLTNDSQLIQDYNSKLDTHSVVAISAFDLPIDEEPRATLKSRVGAEYAYQRELAKIGTFTWLYAGGPRTLAMQLGIPLEVATRIIEALKDRYRGVAAWQEAVQETVKREGSISTPWGRTRRFLIHPGLDQKVIDEQLRESINFPNQAMSSDVNLAAFAELESMGIETLFPFHDAVYAQAPEAKADSVSRSSKSVMEAVLPGPVKFEAEVKVGPNWAQLG